MCLIVEFHLFCLLSDLEKEKAPAGFPERLSQFLLTLTIVQRAGFVNYELACPQFIILAALALSLRIKLMAPTQAKFTPKLAIATSLI